MIFVSFRFVLILVCFGRFRFVSMYFVSFCFVSLLFHILQVPDDGFASVVVCSASVSVGFANECDDFV